MNNEQKPGDPADRAADGAFGGVQSHRAGYGDDKLARLVDYLRQRPSATLASGEGALLLAEIDRLRAAAKDSADHYADARAEIDRLRDQLYLADQSARSSSAEAARLGRILAALREPNEAVVEDAASKMHDVSEPDGDCRIAWEDCIPWYHITRRKMTTAAIRAAVAAAEQEVGE